MARPCSYCGSTTHTAFRCRSRPNKPLRKESITAKKKRQKTASMWFRKNPSDENGNWECWLQISELCPKKLSRETITLEHVYPKVKNPELKYNYKNLKPSCAFCNKLKGSNTPEQLAKYFLHIAILLTTPEWKEWHQNLLLLNS